MLSEGGPGGMGIIYVGDWDNSHYIVCVFCIRVILDLNEIHKDLNEHVHGQGENIDDIGMGMRTGMGI